MTDFERTRARFHLPEGVAYLDGNSLGPMPLAALETARTVIAEQWGNELIRAWNTCDWIGLPRRVGDRVGALIGALPGTVTMGDTLSIKVYQALAAALALRPGGRVIVSDSGNFPTDLYMAQGLIATLGQGHELRVVAPEAVAAAIDGDLAALLLTEVDYRTGRLHDIADLTARAHDAGGLVISDLAHSAGALPVDVAAQNVDFAVGCTYKYLNGGPGAPAFIYVAPRHADHVAPALAGWMGHDAPFAFEPGYRPAPGIERMRVGTPPVIALAVLDAALDAWDGVALDDLRARSIELSEAFIAAVETRCGEVALASPREPARRGSQVSFRHPEGYAIMQALIADGVIGDFRAPDVLRFGFAPLYNTRADVERAADSLAAIVAERRWDRAEFRKRARVT